MARKAIEITIDTQGRDYGKTFEINEMNSDAAERWARRALQCYIQRGGVIPEGLSLSFATLQSMGIANVLANLYADLTDELCDECFSISNICHQIARKLCQSWAEKTHKLKNGKPESSYALNG